MGFKRVIKKSFSEGFSFKKWVGVDSLKTDTKMLRNIFKGVFKKSRSPSSEAKSQSFEDAMRKYGVDEAELKTRMRNAKAIVAFCLLAAVIVFGYFLYFVAFFSQYLSGFVCLTLMALLIAYAFREHFNLFQMRQRRLGCTVQEWFNATFRKGKVK